MMLSIVFHAVLALVGVSVVNALPAKQLGTELFVFEALETNEPKSDQVPELKEPTVAEPVPRERPVLAAAKPNKLIVAEEEALPGDDTVLNGDEAGDKLSHGFVSLEATSAGEGTGRELLAARTQTLAPTVSKPKPVLDLKPLRDRWLNSVSRTVRLRAARDYSQRSLRRHEEGLVKVRLTVDGSGRITSVQIASSSGYATLDRSALQSVQSVGQVPAPPPELAWADRPIIVPVDYRLRQ
jgi:TonB family protein